MSTWQDTTTLLPPYYSLLLLLLLLLYYSLLLTSSLLVQAAAPECEEAVLASTQHPAIRRHMPTDSPRALLSASLGNLASATPRHQSPGHDADLSPAEEEPTCSQATDHQTGTSSEPKVDCLGQDDFLPELAPSAALGEHLCEYRLKPEGSSESVYASSCISDLGSQPSTPASESDTSAPAASSTVAPLRGDIDQQVAVLSVLAGVAADPACAPTSPSQSHTTSQSHRHSVSANDTDPSGQPQSSVPEPLVPSTEGASSGSKSTNGGSCDIYDALREARPRDEDWQVVKASRKGNTSTSKASADATHEISGSAEQHGTASKRREPVESQSRSQEAVQEAANMNGNATHLTYPVRRSASQASMSSWASIDTTDMHDRYSRQLLILLVKPCTCWSSPVHAGQALYMLVKPCTCWTSPVHADQALYMRSSHMFLLCMMQWHHCCGWMESYTSLLAESPCHHRGNGRVCMLSLHVDGHCTVCSAVSATSQYS